MRRFTSAAVAAFGVFFLQLGFAWALDGSKGAAGSNHAAAHALSTGLNIKVGVIEAGGGVNPVHTSMGARLVRNLDFRGTDSPLAAQPPGVGVFTDPHGTRVAEIIGSSDAQFTGVAPGSLLYVAGTDGADPELFAAVEWYHRNDAVGIFNLSLGGPAIITRSDERPHSNVAGTLLNANSTIDILAAGDKFTFTSIPYKVTDVRLRLGLNDGDTAAGEFDEDNLVVELDGVRITNLLVNGYGNGVDQMRTLVAELTPAETAALMPLLADNQVVAKIARIAKIMPGDNPAGNNNLTPKDVGGVKARLTLGQANDGGANKLAAALDYHAYVNDTLIIVSAGNEGGTSRQIGAPADLWNGISVGATDAAFNARAEYSSYWIVTDDGTLVESRGKPEILAPGTGIETEFLNPADGTSFAAPHVAGIAALIAEGTPNTAGVNPGQGGMVSRDHLIQKAIILNSARKRGIEGPNAANQTARDHANTGNEASDGDYLNGLTSLRPGNSSSSPKTREWTPSNWGYFGGVLSVSGGLDDEQGVGLADAERALHQLDGGQYLDDLTLPGGVGSVGWAVDQLSGGNSHSYTIKEHIRMFSFITATLVWDRPMSWVDDADGKLEFENDSFVQGALPDFDLYVYYKGNLIAQSVASSIINPENVEHLHFPAPFPGAPMDYRIDVKLHGALGNTSYALAWWTTVPEPSGVAIVIVIAAAGLARRRAA